MKKLYIEGYIPVGEYGNMIKNNNEIYIEKIRKGAFNTSLMLEDNIKLLWNHDESRVLDSVENRLKIKETDKGLVFSAIIEDENAIKLIQNNKINVSFGFNCYKDRKINCKQANIRIVDILRLNEITLTTKRTYYKGEVTKACIS